jgi:RNA polymerase sigma factor (sigma-70 family)
MTLTNKIKTVQAATPQQASGSPPAGSADQQTRSEHYSADLVQEAQSRIIRLGDLPALRHLRERLTATDSVKQLDMRDPFAYVASPEHILLAREELEALERQVEALPPKCRLALMMVKLDNASYKEVGVRLGIKPYRARRLVERAMEYLLEAETLETSSA